MRFLFLLLFIAPTVFAQSGDDLHIKSEKKVGQIEVGSPYVGIETHNSFPALNRISFYYPVANSIDISEDYWKRENFRIMTFGIKAGNSEKKILREEVYKVDQTPFSAEFNKQYDEFDFDVKYEFCKNKPAMVVTYSIKNISGGEKEFELFTRLKTTLRTSHSYNLIDSAYTKFDSSNNVIRINFENPQTTNAQIFIANAGLQPSSFTSKYSNGKDNLTPDEYWLKEKSPLPNEIIKESVPDKPDAAFVYQKKLAPDESFKVVQIVGSSKIDEAEELTGYLLKNYETEIEEYKNYILEKSVEEKIIVTGDENLDFTTNWAQAVMATNAHYIDGSIQPMPAQAEYNFYFTHDVLLADLAAVNFDLPRVKKDLKFIVDHANEEKIIPHAYYWKDSSFKTEYAGTENWNHFWFILVSVRYFRHSGDKEFLSEIFPYIEKSLETALKNKGDDNLMYSFRPDWWDIGQNYGPRAYMTILAARALREFVFASSALNKPDSTLIYYDELAESLNENLVEELWSDSLKYLISYFEDGSPDKHIYMGSMLASHFNLLNEEKSEALMQTAKQYLLDKNLGVYTLFPMDLNELTEYMGFVKGEAGEPFHYANGGIWNHGNSWYALGLIADGKQNEAYRFIDKIMTINGIIKSPNGQPAMYEYRISDKNNPDVYGKIDKPQFLWAASWYIYTLYNLLGVRENEWNISLNPYLPSGINSADFKMNYNNRKVKVEISGEGENISSIKYDGMEIPSAVIPDGISDLKKIKIELGETSKPYVKNINAQIIAADYDSSGKNLSLQLKTYKGKNLELEIISPFQPEKIFNAGREIEFDAKKRGINFELLMRDKADKQTESYMIKFN